MNLHLRAWMLIVHYLQYLGLYITGIAFISPYTI
nr:MAG TPA: hypothetical protein [Bacteriophage sp.]